MEAQDNEARRQVRYVRDKLDRHEADTGHEFDELKDQVRENGFKIKVVWAGLTATLATLIGWIINQIK